MDVSRIVVPELCIWSATRWVRGINVLTAFTACATNSDVEASVTARITRLGLTILTIEQTSGERRCQTFSSRAMIGRVKVAAITYRVVD